MTDAASLRESTIRLIIKSQPTATLVMLSRLSIHRSTRRGYLFQEFPRGRFGIKRCRTLSGSSRDFDSGSPYVNTTMREFRTKSRWVGATVFPLLSFALCSSPTLALAFSSSSQHPNGSRSFTSQQATASSNNNAVEIGPLSPIVEKLDNSWPRQLAPETKENLLKSQSHEKLSPATDDNRTKRPVFNGHYVPVKPTGLRNPRLILYSQDVAHNLLGLSDEQVSSDEFLKWVSGNLVLGETWATPYALSIMGSKYTSNCPYGTGDGYGDGRAISIAEFNGYELQLKGAGTTPFHRGADGRAVLRSSIREFLASEAMHWLGIPTTRALSLIVSENGETVNRPWYSDNVAIQIPPMDDPRLEQYSDDQKREIISRLRNQKADPNQMVTEPCAITCRVAPSFTRIGHLDLFARRAERKSMQNAEKTDSRFDTSTEEWKELEQMIWHACYREYRKEAYDPFFEKNDIASAATVLLEKSAEKLATMVAHWIRVGFVQGNFNADNNLIGGYTMDYGPFGWVEEYNPLYAKWTGSGEHFGFMNQPNAGYANYHVLVSSVVPVIAAAKGEEDPDKVGQPFMERAQKIFAQKVDETFRLKLGFKKDADVADEVYRSLEPLLRSSRVDWTLFWRQLTYVAEDFPDLQSTDYEGMMSKLEDNELDDDSLSNPFYEALKPELRRQWVAWIEHWREALRAANSGDVTSNDEIHRRMRSTNPKYVLREWMLVDAYSAAGAGDETILHELYK